MCWFEICKSEAAFQFEVNWEYVIESHLDDNEQMSSGLFRKQKNQMDAHHVYPAVFLIIYYLV